MQDAVRYLFPSGLYDKKAHPSMKPPEEVFPPRKAPQFDRTGRPLVLFFYAKLPNFYSLCHVRRWFLCSWRKSLINHFIYLGKKLHKQEAFGHMKELDKIEDARIREQKEPDPTLQL